MAESWRKSRIDLPDFNKNDIKVCPATKFFDQLSYIGDEIVGCFLLETAKGLVLIDCMNPDNRSAEIIEKGISDLGHNINDLHAIVISHGHGDHFGKAGYFKEKYGAEIYMSEIDYNYAKNMPSDMQWEPISFTADHFLEDGGSIDFGDVKIKTVFTPGHTRGCFSFLIPVTDEGRKHTAALWGGAGLMRGSILDDYLVSWEKFSGVCRENGVDSEISTHPFLDMTLQRLEMVRSIVNGVPNPFVIGEEGYRYYEKMFFDYALSLKK